MNSNVAGKSGPDSKDLIAFLKLAAIGLRSSYRRLFS
jgi:hypothetical protein